MSGANPLTEIIKPHAPALVEAAAAGDRQAGQVITLYNMHVACPGDPGAPELCKVVFERWMQDRLRRGVTDVGPADHLNGKGPSGITGNVGQTKA